MCYNNNMKKNINKIKNPIDNFLKILNKEDIKVLPGSIAFSLVTSLAPALLLGVLFCAKMNISISSIVNFLSEIIPKDVHRLLDPVINNIKPDGLSIWYVILGIILASNGTDAIILASNKLYGDKEGSYFRRRIKALVMIIVIAIVFLFLLVVIAFGNNILKFILSLKVFTGFSSDIYNLFLVLKWPIAILMIALLVKIIYTIAPDRKVKSKYVNKGALFTTIGWVILTGLYTFYTSNVANYDILYGSLSSLIILMLWIYGISYILVIGIAINANEYELENDT